MDWRPASSVRLGLTEANQRWPSRNTASDGMLGDAAHQARPSSDHNPDDRGVVHAFDLTHDPAHGVDCAVLSAGIVDGQDPRLRYVIFNRRICPGPWSDAVMAGRTRPWVWVPYDGPNPHDHHMHVSVGYSAAAENDLRPWYAFTVEDDMTTDELASFLKSTDGKKILRAALWGGVGDEIPSVEGTVNAAQTVEVAARGVRANALTLKGHGDALDGVREQLAVLQATLIGLGGGGVAGDVMVTGALHLEPAPPPAPPAG